MKLGCEIRLPSWTAVAVTPLSGRFLHGMARLARLKKRRRAPLAAALQDAGAWATIQLKIPGRLSFFK
jgi:hypothetical protein